MLGTEQTNRLELSVYDILDDLNVRTGDELTKLMEQMHECLENAALDYAMDLDIYDDYEASF